MCEMTSPVAIIAIVDIGYCTRVAALGVFYSVGLFVTIGVMIALSRDLFF